MYLARLKTRYVIRQTYADDGLMKSRDLFDLGSDPRQHIVYVGGSGYYYSDDIQEALAEAGVDVDQDQLDEILFDFLAPKIQRVIHGFDRRRRRSGHAAISEDNCAGTPHLFDKLRYQFIRFGQGSQPPGGCMPEKVFKTLYVKSRDELEQYFIAQEQLLGAHEKADYIASIFELKRFVPDNENGKPLLDQIDAFFLTRLCRLNEDPSFWSGMPMRHGLHDYLVKYAVVYFDFDPPHRSPWQAYVEDFINRHRAYQPPAKVKIKLEEAGKLFGLPWKKLKILDKTSLSRLYRKLALKHHPDQGGDPDLFRRLTQFYEVLLKKRR